MVGRILGAIGGGLIGSLVSFFVIYLFGGSQDSAYTASFYGFWIFAVLGLFVGGKKRPLGY